MQRDEGQQTSEKEVLEKPFKVKEKVTDAEMNSNSSSRFVFK